MNWVGFAVAAFIVIGTSGCGGGEDTPRESVPFEASGTVTLQSADFVHRAGEVPSGPCRGTGGYSDISSGASVVVRNADGKKIGLGQLGDGRPSGGDYGGSCTFDFKVEDIPDDGDIYSVEVGDRGEVSFKEVDAQTLALTIGSLS